MCGYRQEPPRFAQGCWEQSRISYMLAKHFTSSAIFPAPMGVDSALFKVFHFLLYCLPHPPHLLTWDIEASCMPCLVFIINLTHLRVTSEEQVSDQMGLWLWLLGIALIVDQCGTVQPTVGGSTPRQVVLSYKIRLAEHKPEQKGPASQQTAFLYDFCSKFLAWAPSWIPLGMDCYLGV